MEKSKSKRVIVLCAVLFLAAVSVAGCAQPTEPTGTKEPSAYEKLLDSYADSKPEMFIAGHGAPPATEAEYRLAREMGLTHLYVDDIDDAELAAAKATGMKLVPGMGNALNIEHPSVDWSKDYSAEKYAGVVDFVDYFDEPMPGRFDLISGWVDRHNEKYAKTEGAVPVFFANMHPMDGFPNSNYPDVTDEDYIRLFCEKIMAKVAGNRILSYDLYPMRVKWKMNTESGKLEAEKTYIADEWLRSLELMAKYSALYKASGHAYLQTCGFWLPYDGGWNCRKTGEEDLRLQVYTSMAFGIRNFSHFTYTTSENLMTGYGYTVACLDTDGKPGETYYAAQKVDVELLNLDPVFQNFRHTGNMTYTGSENPAGSTRAFRLLKESVDSLDAVGAVSCTADTVIGQFRDDTRENDGLMIVNYNETTDVISDTVTLTLREGSGMAVYQRGAWREYKAVKGKVTVSLAPGDGVFAVVLK